MVKLKVEETSGVDHPAHLQEGWIVMKAKEPAMAKESKDIMDDNIEDETDFEAMLAKMTTERDMYKKMHDDMKKEVGPEDDSDSEEGTEIALLKSMPAPVREMLEKARKDTDAARSDLRKEIESRRDREFVAKAAVWGNLAIDAEDVGPSLRALADFDGDLADNVIKALASANAQAEAANIFAELGTPARPDSGSAYARMTKMAKSAVEAGEFKTIEQAISGLVVANPELYDAYRQESSN